MNVDEQFMARALEEAEQALVNGEFPVGCVMVLDGRIVAHGKRSNSLDQANEMDHAEINALRNLLNRGLISDLSRVTVYSTMEPCLMCFATMLVNGIHRYVYGYEDAMGGGTNLPLGQLAPLYRELTPEITGGVLRRQSLDLFKRFFLDTSSKYLRGSFLAEYTLRQ
jgi:tRNA(adenine34) deaminase